MPLARSLILSARFFGLVVLVNLLALLLLLLPGDVLQFDPVSAEEFDRVLKSDSDGMGGARLEVVA